MQHTLNPRKLLNSKWTSVSPTHKEKHFIVTSVEFDEQGRVIECLIEALMTQREVAINWRELKDPKMWKIGWQ
ncbi:MULTISPECIES: TIGR02450 family Trp-rich protein [Pseudoalteromonas]|uniref:TIGR02450 family Trp-rich protein n=1 Tax=Pseudoalteromonas obscura TaxID=3048491 RepID=A0ABT7ERM7_9GAMM|nr:MULTISPECIES: TIGR02450 family Trp-rich protein [Pseudoalteromonas]MBQ4838984.1 TIGR02450 family Trp-rich protein [Pseudoalteromonas luteoviolacea]MDK2597721.1 TIGR02450 family Trp-rich protein [Pseudoalteromonas sp. P94(2023)]